MMGEKRRGPRTAEELLADPQVRAHQEASIREIRLAEEHARRETAQLRAELLAVGVEIDLIWDLVNTRDSYDPAVPILLEHLKRPYDPRTREGIARALTVKAAKPYAEELIELFKAETDNSSHSVKWAIGNALTVATRRELLPDIIELALDSRHGEARTSLLLILNRSKKPEAREALMRLVSDSGDVGLWAKKYVMSWKSKTEERH
jgi:hypothetical protein